MGSTGNILESFEDQQKFDRKLKIFSLKLQNRI